MAVAIRDAREQDLDALLAVNNNAGPAILPIDATRLRHLYEVGCYFRVAEVDGTIAGFLVALSPAADYDSPNFRWFVQRFDDFVYIDRIVIAKSMRGLGLGRVFYADVQSFAELRLPRLAAEVFLESSSHPALLFHGSFGFHEVGQHLQADGTRACMLMKPLCSHAWIRETYGDALPDVSWLTRPRALPAQQRPTGTCA